MVFYVEGDIDNGLEHLHKLLQDFEKLNDPLTKSHVLERIGMYNKATTNFDKAEKYLFESYEIRKNLGNQYFISNSMSNIANFFMDKGEWETSLQFHEQALELQLKLGLKSSVSASYDNIGAIYNSTNNPQMALKYFLKAHEINIEIGATADDAITQHNIGNAYRTMGLFSKAITHFEESLRIEQDLGREGAVVLAKNLLARTHIQIGEIETANTYLKEAISKMDVLPNDVLRSYLFNDLGRLQLLEGKLDAAFENFSLALQLSKQSPNAADNTEPFYYLISTILNYPEHFISYREKLATLLEEIEKLRDDGMNEVVKMRVDLVKIHHLLSDTDNNWIAAADDLLDKILDREIVDIDLYIQAHLFKIEIMLSKIRENPDLIPRTEEILDKLSTICDDNKIYHTIIRIYTLRARISLLQENFEAAKAYLSTSKRISEDKNYPLLSLFIDFEIDNFLNFYNSKIDTEQLFEDRYTQLDLNEYLSLIIQERLEYMVYNTTYHKIENALSICGDDREPSEKKQMNKCPNCRLISLLNTLNKIAHGSLMAWICAFCYKGLTVQEADDLLIRHSDTVPDPPYYEIFGISTSLLKGKIHWRCQSINCSNTEMNSFDLFEIGELFV